MKGVSTFLATVIIIVIVLVVGVLITSWTGTLVRTETTRAENRSGGCTGVSVGIDDVFFDEAVHAFAAKIFGVPLSNVLTQFVRIFYLFYLGLQKF